MRTCKVEDKAKDRQNGRRNEIEKGKRTTRRI
jgi:hypothetical protein